MSKPPSLPPFPPAALLNGNIGFNVLPTSEAPSLPKMPDMTQNQIKTFSTKPNSDGLDDSSDEDEPPPIPEFPQPHVNNLHQPHNNHHINPADLSDSDTEPETENDEKNTVSPPPLPKILPIPIVVESSATSPVASKYDSKQIYNVAKEFVDTEARFVQTMKILCDLIISPCQAAVVTGKATMGSVAVDSRVQVFFSMAVQIYTLNAQFLLELTKIIDNWSETSNIGSTFIQYAPLFKIFGQYVRDHELISAILLAAAARNGSKFSEFIKQAESDPKAEKQKLSSLLIQPVQRVPRYCLLLQELRRRTPPEHPAYSDLLAACDQANEAAKHVNEAIRQRENREKLVDFEKKFVDKIDLRDTDIPRFLIREGELKRLTRKGATHYYFHLFNDLLMYSEDTVKGYKLHRRVDLGDRCSVEDKSTGDEHSILVSSPQKSFVICTKDAAEKSTWFNDLKTCIQKIKEENSGNNKNSFVAPVWEQDKVANKCTLCETKFTMIKRRHHCRQCGRLVCNSCSNHKLLIKQIDQKNEVRVCDTCFGSQGLSSVTSTNSKTENSVSGVSSHRKSGSLDLGQVTNENDPSFNPLSPVGHPIPRFSNASVNSPPAATSGRVSIVSDTSNSGDEKIDQKLDKEVEENFATRTKLEKQKPKFLSDSRYSIACDLYLSESVYCTDLKNLIELFVKPFLRLITDQNKGKSKTLAASSATINGKKVPPNVLVFLNNIEPIYTLNLELLKNLEKRAVEYNSTDTCFGSLFLRYASLFQLYRQYSVNHFQALEVLQQDTEFRPIMKKYEEECKKLTVMQNQKEIKYVQLFINRIEEGDEEEDEEDQPSSEQKVANQTDTRTNSTGGNATVKTPNIYQPSELLHTLEELLRSPILRCSKYSWFLTQLHKQTKETHKDYSDLLSAEKAIQSAIEAIQQSVMEGDNMAKLVELEKKFVGGGSKVKLLEPRRALIKEGMLRRITRRGATNYYFHLFNDLLLYSEETVKGYKLHRWMPLNEVSVQDKLNDDTQPNAIQVLSPQKSFVVCARDSGEKKRWLDSLIKAVNNVTHLAEPHDNNTNNNNNHSQSPNLASASSDNVALPQSPKLNSSASVSTESNTTNSPPTLNRAGSTAAPVWTQDSAVSVCTHCNKTKFGLITRRHHCRKCGKVVCDGCSKNKMLLPHIHKTELQRVCDGCWVASGNALKTSPKTSPKSAAGTMGTSPTLTGSSSPPFPNPSQSPNSNNISQEANNNNINNNAIANLPVVGSLDKPNFFIE